MRLLFVADGRSPIALNWIDYFLAGDHQVHLASTFPCPPDPRLASYTFIPTAFSQVKKTPSGGGGRKRSLGGGTAVRLRTLLRQWLGPLTLPEASRRLGSVIQQIQPELVRVLRIPYEGMLAALAQPEERSLERPIPLLISARGFLNPPARLNNDGFRCARSP